MSRKQHSQLSESVFELTVMFFGLTNSLVVKIVDDGLYFIFPFHFYFTFLFFSFHFSIFRTARVRVDWSRCHISHKLMAKSQD